MTNNKEPNFQDEVKHKTADIVGTVIAKYADEDDDGFIRTYLDVRADEKVYDHTPADNWEITKAVDE